MVAAQEAARYAGLSAAAAWIIGLVSLALTGGGLFFIWRQLKSTELAAQAAAAGAEAASLTSRPWVTLSIERVHFGMGRPDDPDAVSCQVDYTVKNIGKTPAIQCGIVYDVFVGKREDQTEEIREKLLSIEPLHPRALFPNDSIKQGISQPKNFSVPPVRDSFTVIVAVAVFYKVHAGGEWKYTMQFGTLQPMKPRDDIEKNFDTYKGMPFQEVYFLDMRKVPDPT